jgi:DNA-binding MarR family transcriptional regulator
MAQSGYIYVLANSTTDGIVKIGKTRQKPDARARALSSSSGVPAPFIVVYQAYFGDCDKAERFVHSKLENFRISNNREFFRVATHVAVDAIIEAKNNLDDPENASNLTKDGICEHNADFESVAFGTVQEPERGLYELLDVLMNQSMRGWTDYIKNMGLSMPQFSILMQLHYCGGYSISEISNHFGVSVPAASQLVEKLVQAGYLERAEDPKDRRARLLPLSSKGKKLIEQGFKGRYHWLDELIAGLSIEEREKVIQALKMLTERAKQANTYMRKHV